MELIYAKAGGLFQIFKILIAQTLKCIGPKPKKCFETVKTMIPSIVPDRLQYSIGI
jgi:hypothetical protein